ncbi:hypothetical protein M0R01_04470 [bacterium]|jgi:hypothetical protein|nr:hypothetical protein [bacterium]
MKTLKLKNYFFIGTPEENGVSKKSVGLAEWLGNQMLHGQASRSRTRFLQLIAPILQELDKTRIELLKKYAEKKKVKQGKEGEEKEVELPVMFYPEVKVSENGEEIIEVKETTDEHKGKKYKIKDVDGFNKEYQDYLNEDYIVDVLPSNKNMIEGVKDILLKSHEEFGGRQALLYDEWCNAFENLTEVKEEEVKENKKDKKDKK